MYQEYIERFFVKFGTNLHLDPMVNGLHFGGHWSLQPYILGGPSVVGFWPV